MNGAFPRTRNGCVCSGSACARAWITTSIPGTCAGAACSKSLQMGQTLDEDYSKKSSGKVLMHPNPIEAAAKSIRGDYSTEPANCWKKKDPNTSMATVAWPTAVLGAWIAEMCGLRLLIAPVADYAKVLEMLNDFAARRAQAAVVIPPHDLVDCPLTGRQIATTQCPKSYGHAVQYFAYFRSSDHRDSRRSASDPPDKRLPDARVYPVVRLPRPGCHVVRTTPEHVDPCRRQ